MLHKKKSERKILCFSSLSRTMTIKNTPWIVHTISGLENMLESVLFCINGSGCVKAVSCFSHSLMPVFNMMVLKCFMMLFCLYTCLHHHTLAKACCVSSTWAKDISLPIPLQYYSERHNNRISFALSLRASLCFSRLPIATEKKKEMNVSLMRRMCQCLKWEIY